MTKDARRIMGNKKKTRRFRRKRRWDRLCKEMEDKEKFSASKDYKPFNDASEIATSQRQENENRLEG